MFRTYSDVREQYMKYRFRRCPKKKRTQNVDLCTLRFAGKNTLRLLHPLPEPIEAIRLEDEKQGRRVFTKISRTLKRIFLWVEVFFKEILKELRAAARRLAIGARKLLERISLFILKKAEERKKKKIDSLPVLFGAAVSAFLVCILTASYIAMSFFMPYAKSYRSVVIPSLQGKRLEDVELEGSSFNLLVTYESNPDVEDGRIISQIPAAGVTRKIYDKNGYCPISVTVSRQVLPTVPEGLVGNDLRSASLSLLNTGISFTVEEKHSDTAKGTVLGCYPSEGESLSIGGRVTLTVSAGKKVLLSSVPSLVGLTESEALFRIGNASLSIGSVTYVRSAKKPGTVISQSPSAYMSVSAGESIDLTVSAGEVFYTPTVPDLYGLTVEEARAALYSVGLTVSSVYSVSSAAKNKTVIFQSPIAGTPITSSITSVELHISN